MQEVGKDNCEERRVELYELLAHARQGLVPAQQVIPLYSAFCAAKVVGCPQSHTGSVMLYMFSPISTASSMHSRH